MDIGTIIIIIVVGVLLILVFYAIGVYNNLINARNKAKDQFSQIDVQLKRRSDMIPNLVETVKGYAKHESDTLEAVVKARNTYLSASTPEAQMKADGELTQAITKLFALSEAYPELKANENFKQLQSELTSTEDKISYARQFYNDIVMKYNNKIEMFPSNIVAGMFNFKTQAFFEVNEEERQNVKVQF